MAGHLDLEIIRGDTFTKTFTWMDADETPYNIAGWTGRMQARDYADGPVNQTFGNEYFDFTTGANGAFTITVPYNETAGITWSIQSYDIQITNPNVSPNFVKTFLVGQVRCIKDITQ